MSLLYTKFLEAHYDTMYHTILTFRENETVVKNFIPKACTDSTTMTTTFFSFLPSHLSRVCSEHPPKLLPMVENARGYDPSYILLTSQQHGDSESYLTNLPKACTLTT